MRDDSAALAHGKAELGVVPATAEQQDMLADALMLLCYHDPFGSPQGALMSPAARTALADDVDAALLAARQRPQQSALERLYCCLVDPSPTSLHHHINACTAVPLAQCWSEVLPCTECIMQPRWIGSHCRPLGLLLAQHPAAAVACISGLLGCGGQMADGCSGVNMLLVACADGVTRRTGTGAASCC